MQFVLLFSVAAQRLFVPAGRAAPADVDAMQFEGSMPLQQVGQPVAYGFVQPVQQPPPAAGPGDDAVKAAVVVAAAAGAAYLAAGRGRAAQARSPAPRMQFWKQGGGDTKQKNDGGTFRDDERDTTGGPQFGWWRPEDSGVGEGEMTDVERAGFSANGKDLATDGLLIYAAFIPALLFAFLYFNGSAGDPYAGGNYGR